MDREALGYSKILDWTFKSALGALSIILVFAGLNDHFDPIHYVFVFIEEVLGSFGVFVFSGIFSALIYLALARVLLRIEFKEGLDDSKKVAIISYILMAIIWSYIYFIFRPD